MLEPSQVTPGVPWIRKQALEDEHESETSMGHRARICQRQTKRKNKPKRERKERRKEGGRRRGGKRSQTQERHFLYPGIFWPFPSHSMLWSRKRQSQLLALERTTLTQEYLCGSQTLTGLRKTWKVLVKDFKTSPRGLWLSRSTVGAKD